MDRLTGDAFLWAMTAIRTRTGTDRDDPMLRAIGLNFVRTPTATLLILAVPSAIIWRAG
jgi:hypothetical protein